MELAYGNGFIDLEISRSYTPIILEQSTTPPVFDIDAALSACFYNLNQLLIFRRPHSAAILVEDKTRKNPEYPVLLNHIIQMLKQNDVEDITLIPAYGTHKHHSEDDHIRLYGKENLDQIKLIEHDCRNNASFIHIGNLPSGTQIKINSAAIQNDFIITLGSVAPHAFAGFTGGPKIFLPGIANYEAIRESHSQVISQHSDIGVLDENPVHEIIMSIVDYIHVDFTIQTVHQINGKIAAVFYGDMESSYKAAIDFCRKTCSIQIPDDIKAVIVGCGGMPRDESLYQAQRVISTATKALKTRGFAIVVGEFSQGIGNDLLEDSLRLPREEVLSLKPEQIEIGVHSAYLMCRNLERADISFITNLDNKKCREISLNKIERPSEINSFLSKKVPNGTKIYIIPNGSNILISN